MVAVLPFGKAASIVAASLNLAANSKTLIAGRAIATWPAGIPAGEKRPVIVFLPGWGGVGAVNASVSGQNNNLVNQGYVTLAIGFDSSATWISDIDVKTAQGLDLLCADATIPANCDAIVLDGVSYGGAQNYWVMEYIRGHGYDGGAGSSGTALGFLSEDAGYGAPGVLTNPASGAFTRTGLADTASYSVAMIENLGDTTFPVDECTWGNCGARELGDAHLARGDDNVFSICPPGGGHGTRGFANWNAWVISAIKTIIHITNGIPTFTGYANPALSVSNTCVNANALPGLSISGINIVANGQPVQLYGVNMGDPFWARGWYGASYSTANYAALSQNWHANVARISIFPTQWKNMDHATLLAGLAQEVNAALNNGMYVIISYHVIGWPDGFYQTACCGNPADTYDSSMSVATAFWTQMAQTYGSDNRIIFDLWNEPVHPDDFTLYGSDPNPLWTELKQAYESLIQTVRANGAQNIVLATGNRWASWLVGIKDNPLADPNVAYAYHKYSVEGLNTAAEWNRDTGGLIGVRPVIVSEWGYEDSDVSNPTWPGSQASYGTPFTQWMDSRHLSNLAWMYHHDWTPALLKADGSLTLYGTFVRNYLLGSVTVTVQSSGAQDGWVLESTETSKLGGTLNSVSTVFSIGDDAQDRQYRAILSFNTASLPDTAVITKVTLKIKKQGLVGTDPFTILGALRVDIRKPYFGSAVGLENSDFQAAAGKSNIGNIPNTPVSNWYTKVWSTDTFFSFINRTGTTQFRLRFVTDDNNDNGADYMKFFSGDTATAGNRPTLIIEYYVP